MSSPIIITKLMGGLGNQLFQYAVGRHLAHLNDGILKLDITGFVASKSRDYALQHFNIAADLATAGEIRKFSRVEQNWLLRHIASHPSTGITRLGSRSYVREQSLAYDEQILRLAGNLYLEGYWQSEKYFEGISDKLRAEVVVVTAPTRENREMASRIQSRPSASIHVRLGDYASDPVTTNVHGTLSPDYYERAVAHVLDIQPETHFFVFSDEPQRAAQRVGLPASKITTVSINDASRGFEDLRLMSLADYHIIANSSFSWWAAWLTKNHEGTVVAPLRWFRDERRDASTILPAGWLAL